MESKTGYILFPLLHRYFVLASPSSEVPTRLVKKMFLMNHNQPLVPILTNQIPPSLMKGRSINLWCTKAHLTNINPVPKYPTL